ncbi:hypothetical protein E2C01_088431 [Portunus trituberculatus]|uniref:Uncharacterized protein n=1 Tax=Portunus trituberculatus TaxID=210409 RepID=A0A5B7JJD0_PORTR|nr:hypothetical protein [Portunus trituberculatus]
MCKREYDRIPAKPEWRGRELFGIAVGIITREWNTEVHPCVSGIAITFLFLPLRLNSRSSFLLVCILLNKYSCQRYFFLHLFVSFLWLAVS